MDARFQQLTNWLQGSEEHPHAQGLLQSSQHLIGKTFGSPVPASSDASFRRYFRIESDASSFIIMDAPPEHENCQPFIQISAELAKMGLQVPEVLEQDLMQGFLLLTDLGSTTYLKQLEHLRATGGSESEAQIDRLYRQALQALVTLQKHNAKNGTAKGLPAYNNTLLNTEMNLFSDWLCRDYLSLPELTQTFWADSKDLLAKSALAQPQTYVHRDYHSRNLMLTDARNPGVLDFQDAVQGALSYDAVSLLRDCYIAWPQEQVSEWQRAYFLDLCDAGLLSSADWNGFVEAMDLMGIQRHLKASGIFARLSLRDGKEGYLPDVPQTLDYIAKVGAKYPQLKALTAWVEDKVQPKFAEVYAEQTLKANQ